MVSKRGDIRDGIMRKIDRGSIWEGQLKNGQLHGLMRIIKADGSYQTAVYRNNVLDGVMQAFSADGEELTELKITDG